MIVTPIPAQTCRMIARTRKVHITMQHTEPVPGYPDEMVAMMKCRMTSGRTAHGGYRTSRKLKPASG